MRPISLVTNGLISNGLKSKSVAANGLFISTTINLQDAIPLIYSVDHKLKNKKRYKDQIEREEKEILEIVSFISKRIL